MKKTFITISIAILTVSLIFTACTNSNNIIVDKYGDKYIAVTDDDGNMVQDQWGNLIIEVTDEKGEKATQKYIFPEKITNKKNTKIENSVVKINLPDKWEIEKNSALVRLVHNGKCSESKDSVCQIDFGYQNNYTLQEVYNNYMVSVVNLSTLGDDVKNITEDEITLMGMDAKVIYYSIESTNADVYYFVIENELAMMEIKAYIFDDCYSYESLVELINSCATAKKLPKNEYSTDPTKKFTQVQNEPTTDNNK